MSGAEFLPIDGKVGLQDRPAVGTFNGQYGQAKNND
jgi:hypothetical protein